MMYDGDEQIWSRIVLILLDCISFLFAISVCRNNYLLVWHLFHPQQNLQAIPVEELRKQRGRDLFQQDPKFGESQNEFLVESKNK